MADDPEKVLADGVQVALENTDTPELSPATRLQIVRGVLRVAWNKYRALKEKRPAQGGPQTSDD